MTYSQEVHIVPILAAGELSSHHHRNSNPFDSSSPPLRFSSQCFANPIFSSQHNPLLSEGGAQESKPSIHSPNFLTSPMVVANSKQNCSITTTATATSSVTNDESKKDERKNEKQRKESKHHRGEIHHAEVNNTEEHTHHQSKGKKSTKARSLQVEIPSEKGSPPTAPTPSAKVSRRAVVSESVADPQTNPHRFQGETKVSLPVFNDPEEEEEEEGEEEANTSLASAPNIFRSSLTGTADSSSTSISGESTRSSTTGSGGLFLGRINYILQGQQKLREYFQANKIGAVVSCLSSRSSEVDATLRASGIDEANHIYFEIDDSMDCDGTTKINLNFHHHQQNEHSAPIFNVLKFIHRKRTLEGKGVMVHCDGGIQRSPMILSAYLIVHGNYALEQCKELLSRKAPSTQFRRFEPALYKLEKTVMNNFASTQNSTAVTPAISRPDSPIGELMLPSFMTANNNPASPQTKMATASSSNVSSSANMTSSGTLPPSVFDVVGTPKQQLPSHNPFQTKAAFQRQPLQLMTVPCTPPPVPFYDAHQSMGGEEQAHQPKTETSSPTKSSRNDGSSSSKNDSFNDEKQEIGAFWGENHTH